MSLKRPLIIVVGVLAICGVLALFGFDQQKRFLQQSETGFLQAEFDEYLVLFGKEYGIEEYYVRKSIFLSNLEVIRNFNRIGESWVMGLGPFTDMSSEEFSKTLLQGATGDENRESENFNFEDKRLLGEVSYPTSVDWRTSGAVTPVANQGNCASGWAFSAAGALEGAWEISGNQLTALSEQQLLDCSTRYGNTGCSGGLMDYAFNYMIANGLTSDTVYPYMAAQGTCKQGIVASSSMTSFNDVPPNDPNVLYQAVAQQPVSAAVDADPYIWQNYKGGIISRNCGADLNHGVLIVGYSSNSNPPYWIIKNSFGQNWGESGYIRLAVAQGEGVCGVQKQTSYPNIK